MNNIDNNNQKNEKEEEEERRMMYTMMSSSSGNEGGGGGPCGACKYLRRKCVSGCVFAPYFDAEKGAVQFAAVHKVFGASNASKILLRLPPGHARLHAVLSLSYEAISRLRDPVYGCVAHLFSLQQQVVKLQAELAYVQARLSTLQHYPVTAFHNPQTSQSSSDFGTTTSDLTLTSSNPLMHFDHQPLLQPEMTSFFCPVNPNLDAGDLQTLGRQLESRYSASTGPRLSSTSH